jgi:hypothetical protein
MKTKELEIATTTYRVAYKKGYTQCQEDNADKKYTEDDLHNLLRARRQLYSHTDKNVVRDFINSLNKQD